MEIYDKNHIFWGYMEMGLHHQASVAKIKYKCITIKDKVGKKTPIEKIKTKIRKEHMD